MQDQLDTHTRKENKFRYVEVNAKEAVLKPGGDHTMQSIYRERLLIFGPRPTASMASPSWVLRKSHSEVLGRGDSLCGCQAV